MEDLLQKAREAYRSSASDAPSLLQALLALSSLLEPPPEEHSLRKLVLEDVNQVLSTALGPESKVSVIPYGSHICGLDLTSSDLDLALGGEVHPSTLATSALTNPLLEQGQLLPLDNMSPIHRVAVLSRVADALEADGKVIKLERVFQARIPIIRFVHKSSGIPADVCVGTKGKTIKGDAVAALARLTPLMARTYRLVKCWARTHDLNDASQGTFNSWSLTLMTIFSLQTGQPALLPPLYLPFTKPPTPEEVLCLSGQEPADTCGATSHTIQQEEQQQQLGAGVASDAGDDSDDEGPPLMDHTDDDEEEASQHPAAPTSTASSGLTGAEGRAGTAPAAAAAGVDVATQESGRVTLNACADAAPPAPRPAEGAASPAAAPHLPAPAAATTADLAPAAAAAAPPPVKPAATVVRALLPRREDPELRAQLQRAGLLEEAGQHLPSPEGRRLLEVPELSEAEQQEALARARDWCDRVMSAGGWSPASTWTLLDTLHWFFTLYSHLCDQWKHGWFNEWRVSVWRGRMHCAPWSLRYLVGIEEPFDASDNTARSLGTKGRNASTLPYLQFVINTSLEVVAKARQSGSVADAAAAFVWLWGEEGVLVLADNPPPDLPLVPDQPAEPNTPPETAGQPAAAVQESQQEQEGVSGAPSSSPPSPTHAAQVVDHPLELLGIQPELVVEARNMLWDEAPPAEVHRMLVDACSGPGGPLTLGQWRAAEQDKLKAAWAEAEAERDAAHERARAFWSAQGLPHLVPTSLGNPAWLTPAAAAATQEGSGKEQQGVVAEGSGGQAGGALGMARAVGEGVSHGMGAASDGTAAAAADDDAVDAVDENVEGETCLDDDEAAERVLRQLEEQMRHTLARAELGVDSSLVAAGVLSSRGAADQGDAQAVVDQSPRAGLGAGKQASLTAQPPLEHAVLKARQERDVGASGTPPLT